MLTVAEKELVRRAKELTQELADFLAVREETAPSVIAWHESDATREAIADSFARSVMEIQTAYAERFAGRVLAQVEAFAAVGITPQGDRVRFTHPTNPIGVREVMVALGYLAEKLELRG